MKHYYSSQPTAGHDIRTIVVGARNRTVELKTDSGVFSKKGLDFGTRVLIETAVLPDEGIIVDLGCGYGPVTGLLAQVYPRTHWVMLDINQRAVELAKLNLSRFEERVTVYESDGFSAVPGLRAQAILLNPPIRAGKRVVYRLFHEASNHLETEGSMWVVIQKKQGAASAAKFLQSLFPVVELIGRSGGYHVYCCKNVVSQVS